MIIASLIEVVMVAFVGHVTCYEGKEPRNAFQVRPKT
jgi:hypothetical protein